MEHNRKDVILFVDDEENILKSIKRSLIDEPYKILLANSGKEALDILSKNIVSVIVTDMRMPEMNGIELLEIVKKLYPNIVRIVLTGYAHVSTLIAAINSGQIYRYLIKPWKLDSEFKPTLKQALEYHKLISERNEIINNLKFKTIELQKQIDEKEKLIKEIEESNEKKKKVLTILGSKAIPIIEESINWIETLINTNVQNSTKNELFELRNKEKQVINLLKKIQDIF